jgi:predicted dehydrogenase
LARAKQVASSLEIPKAYGSYQELLKDDSVEVIYNPLPNHLHVRWSIAAAEAGKHVLCEKPIALNSEEAQQLLAARDRTGVKIQEAFMVRTHPQWLGTRELIRTERIGQLRSISGFFSYFNADPGNVRNQPELGGGALMDIGCYPVSMSRFLFEQEPDRVFGAIERDPELGVDRLTSVILDFPRGQSHNWRPISACKFLVRGAASNLKFLLTRQPIGPPASLSMTARISTVPRLRRESFPSAINTPFKRIFSRRRLSKTRSSQFL